MIQSVDDGPPVTARAVGLVAAAFFFMGITPWILVNSFFSEVRT